MEWIAAHGLRPSRILPKSGGTAGSIFRAEMCSYAQGFVAEAPDAPGCAVVMTTTCDQMRRASELARDCADTRIVSVGDRESDIYDIFLEVEKQPTPADFVIRAMKERSTPQREPDAGPAVYRKMHDEVSASPVRGERTVQLPQTPKRKARQANLEIRAIRITVKPPHARSRLPQVTLNVVSVEEVGGPQDGTDVSWLLLTTLSIE